MRRSIRLFAVVMAVALAANLIVGLTYGMNRPMSSDASYFLSIAKSVAAGQGFCLREGFWPDQPTMSRAPAWPLLISAALRICGCVSPDLLMRVLNLALNVGVAALVAALAWRLFRKPAAGLIAGVAWAFHPVALFEACEGNSEILFLAVALFGVLLLLEGSDGLFPNESSDQSAVPAPRWPLSPAYWLGCLALGLACLARTNFLLVGPLAFGIVWVRNRFKLAGRTAVLLALSFVLFALPSGLWAVRNYRVCGDFPVFTTLRGQTIYGGNNAVVADTLTYWGYWVFPDVIPGEKTMCELSRSLSEYEVDCYYTGKAKQFVAANKLAMPRLWLGKLIRAYVPIPWKPGLGSYAVAAVRWILYATAVAGLFLAWRRLGGMYRAILAAMVLANLATVLIFYGYSRFAFELDPFLLPLSAWALVSVMGRREECHA